jgi:hypothetical protein
MPYPVLDDLTARAWWKDWKRQAEAEGGPCEPPEVPPADRAENGGDHDWSSIADEAVAELREALAREGGAAKFEAAACVLLHRSLPTDEALTDPAFWTWFSVAPGLPLIRERYPSTEKKPVPDVQNFTSRSAKETLLYRLWVRAEVARDPERDDPYELARYGDVDFWRSHMFRQTFAEHRDLLTALVAFQYPEGPNGPPRLKGKNQAELRELVKYLRRACANLTVEMMDVERARRFVETEWSKVEAAGGTT